ncbi:hypothetical protein HQ865_11345 [Mucilaginibacter mali]|uniref:Uncharacterized protein n=1 Tax=Mucilaginibacter mali TaxID=2740462 RepID=A0A7D4Q152_9SPHI|nr:hypothetical protein [Mucilaginibacter mali]QKJ30326.1 hypothetical protein HQ865_11345 [Mucilaginibacter mali]
MKNPFERRDNTVLIASLALGTVAVGAATYFVLSEKGAALRQRVTDQFSRVRNLFGGSTLEEHTEPTLEYARKKAKKPKTDREALLHHEILHDNPDNNEVVES